MHNANGKMPQATPLDSWLNDYEVVTLPSGRVVHMRTVNVLTLMNRAGKIPSFVRVRMDAGKGKKAAELDAPTAEDNLEMQELADKVLRAGLVYPPLVETEADERDADGKPVGVTLLRFSIPDKIAVLTWAIGGGQAVDEANRFPEPAAADLQPVPASVEIREITGGDDGDNQP